MYVSCFASNARKSQMRNKLLLSVLRPRIRRMKFRSKNNKRRNVPANAVIRIQEEVLRVLNRFF
jgi:hypothetical protein